MFKSLAAGLAVFLFTTLASADSTTAEALFAEGRRLFELGNYEQACPKFAESQRLDPGTGTLLNLANCYEKQGKLATAWSTWRDAASSARATDQPDREAHARQKAAELQALLARLNITVEPAARVEGLVVTRNGQDQSSATYGTPLPVDAGTYRIEAKAAGYEPWVKEVSLKDGELRTLAIERLVPSQQTAPPPEPTPVAPAQAPPEPQAESDAGASGGSMMKTWGYVSLGVGALGVGVGSYFGVRAINKNEDSKLGCTGNTCNRQGTDDRDAARSAGTISTVMLGVGAALVATGVVLVVVAPSEETAISASPTWGGGSLQLTGSF